MYLKMLVRQDFREFYNWILENLSVNQVVYVSLYEQGKNISRFPRGIPTKIAEIQFNDYENALAQLREILEKWQPNKDTAILD